MRRWMRVLGTAALAATLAGGTASAEDLLEDFLVLGADPDDFLPDSQAASSGSLFFVGGSTTLTDPYGDAAIVALDARDGREVWRATEGEEDIAESFTVVGVNGGRVCAVGTRVARPFLIDRFPLGERVVLVACYRAKQGKRLWVRRIVLDPAREPFLTPKLHVSKRAVVVTLSTVSYSRIPNALVLLFDPKDGTGP